MRNPAGSFNPIIQVILIQVFLLAAYQLGTGKSRLQVPEPWDSLIVYGVMTPQIAVILCWGLFSLVFLILHRRVLGGGGAIQQIAMMMAVGIPFWGLRYYDRLVKRLIETSKEASS